MAKTEETKEMARVVRRLGPCSLYLSSSHTAFQGHMASWIIKRRALSISSVSLALSSSPMYPTLLITWGSLSLSIAAEVLSPVYIDTGKGVGTC